jgi:Fe-S-cluster containining protein
MSGSAPWYEDGLRFECTRCGNCCGGAPGNVYVSEAEIDGIAERLGLDREAFVRRYTRRIRRQDGPHVSLVEKRNHDCIFFERGTGCTIYEDRPKQCRTWPFWRANLASRDEWQATAEDCPGMGRGERWSRERIEAVAADDGLP